VRVGARGSDALVDAVRRLDAACVTIAGLSLRRPSLDDVFLALTGRPVDESAADTAGQIDDRSEATV
jgi:ABC-2 type transport system ATP-binding protein